MTHGAMSEKEAAAQAAVAERPIDQNSLYLQQAEKLQTAEREVTRLAGLVLDLEQRSKILETEAGRFAVIAMRGGVKVETVAQIVAVIPSLRYENLQDVLLEVEQAMKKFTPAQRMKRERAKRSG